MPKPFVLVNHSSLFNCHGQV
jgi:hypothetical protein